MVYGKKNQKKNNNKNVRTLYLKSAHGITLISLVITVILLIILAGVAISLSLGENGIFRKAQQAREEYLNAQGYEETEIAKAVNEIDKYVDGNSRETVTIDKKEYEDMKAKINALNNYSTNEQVVGTWINGKPLYQKTIALQIPQTVARWSIYDISELDIEYAFTTNRIVYHANTNNGCYAELTDCSFDDKDAINASTCGSATVHAFPNRTDGGYKAQIAITLGSVIRTRLYQDGNPNVFVTICYTKTTDKV